MPLKYNQIGAMIKTAQRSLSIALITVALAGCKNTTDTEPATCSPPATLVAQAPCESGYTGVLLIASDYKRTTGPNQLVYSIYPQKDTLSDDYTKSAYANFSDDRIIISETVLKDAPKFAVQVTINCSGKLVESQFFAFVKRPTASPGCYVWALQKKG
ncbi:hypothetical protein FAES_4132 [Fibrella aestuarina BUZ 2]|uniref:Lipoprotein n=2 Tax=Fibrella TaxID=861914 RepID=I0KDC9_9BACT|nr:hypothetical protein FAES_4132 [Fibrella aestuarina BUZ 2]